MGDGAAVHEVRVPLRFDPARLVVEMFTHRSHLRKMGLVVLLLGGYGAAFGAMIGDGPLAVIVGAVIGILLPLLTPAIIMVKRLRSMTTGPGDEWVLTPEGISFTQSGSTSELPWSAVVDLRLRDQSTSVISSAKPLVIHRTEAAVPPELRPGVGGWWQQGQGPEPGQGGGNHSSEPPAPTVPTAPPGPPPPLSVIEVAAELQPGEVVYLAMPSEAKWQRRALGVLLLAVMTVVAGMTVIQDGVTTQTLPYLMIPLIVPLVAGYAFIHLLTRRSRPMMSGRMVARQMVAVWGPGPIRWTLDPSGLTQTGSNGRQFEVPWSELENVAVEGPVLAAAPTTGPGRVVIPTRAFTDDQLARVLAWAQSPGHPVEVPVSHPDPPPASWPGPTP